MHADHHVVVEYKSTAFANVNRLSYVSRDINGDIAPLAMQLPAQNLPLLHVTMPFRRMGEGANSTLKGLVEYRRMFDPSRVVAAIWQGLQSVQVCIQVMVDWTWDDEDDGLVPWNFWVRSLRYVFFRESR